MNGKPTGIVRVSLGGMSSVRDVEAFMAFLRGYRPGPAEELTVLGERRGGRENARSRR